MSKDCLYSVYGNVKSNAYSFKVNIKLYADMTLEIRSVEKAIKIEHTVVLSESDINTLTNDAGVRLTSEEFFRILTKGLVNTREDISVSMILLEPIEDTGKDHGKRNILFKVNCQYVNDEISKEVVYSLTLESKNKPLTDRME